MSVNKLFIAGAGCGKTTFIIEKALQMKGRNILITTYTINNEENIKNKIIEKNGFIPSNINILTWFSFLIHYGANPYLSYFFNEIDKINGFHFSENANYYISHNDKRYYFTDDNKIRSYSLSEFVLRCNKKSNNKVINRLENIFNTIFIDEVQDMSGYDLDIIELLCNSSINLCLVGDLRQRVYKTNKSNKNSLKINNKSYSYNIYDFIKNKCINNCQIDTATLNKSYRNNKEICYFASQLYPSYDIVQSCSIHSDKHEGIYSIKTKEVDKYLELYPNNIIQLRFAKNSFVDLINTSFPVLNFGAVKGLEYDRVIIFLTDGLIKILKNKDTKEYSENKAKLYVAITRAKYSVVFVTDEDLTEYGIKKFNFD
ncbi:UvrD-helicase domain-containing protein [Brachyspira pilosicoli]|uniref:UvrD-helicase domain-containing protein n=1 Tax=Brachyspira pilosicoli TaxID=52584 RepID=UPI0012F6B515|nr:UvrD-helicase domain-containing protein [Brachyspira pilosicoli]